LGLSPARAAAVLRIIKEAFFLLPETSAILTFDQTGFSRFPGIEVAHPASVRPVTAGSN